MIKKKSRNLLHLPQLYYKTLKTLEFIYINTSIHIIVVIKKGESEIIYFMPFIRKEHC